jgi:hypothetical protein
VGLPDSDHVREWRVTHSRGIAKKSKPAQMICAVRRATVCEDCSSSPIVDSRDVWRCFMYDGGMCMLRNPLLASVRQHQQDALGRRVEELT